MSKWSIGVAKVLALISVAAAVAVSGCGRGGSTTSSKTADGVRSTDKQFVQDLKDSKFAEACGLMTESARASVGGGKASDCPKNLAFVRVLLDTTSLNAYLEKVDRLNVTVKGDTASSAQFSGNSTTRYVYAGGRWLIDTGVSSSTTLGATAAVAKTWPSKWCQAHVGMSRAQMRTLMGPPTSEIQQNESSGTPQMSWKYAEFQFNAFMDVNDKVRQLDVNDIQLSASEKAAIRCATTRT